MTANGRLDALPPLRSVIREAELTAKKSLGQNFLLDLNITRRIARAGGPLDGIAVVEVGPGPGGLTRALLLEGARSVVAIERDERFRTALEDLAAASGDRLTLRFEDALRVDFASVAQETGATRLIANLPYNIATPLVIGWLTSAVWPPWFDRLVVMLQREVAERLTAIPRTSSYGRLSVIGQARTVPRMLFTLPGRVFTPSPKVESALVEIRLRTDAPPHLPVACLERITALAFGQRRKMLRSSLAGLGPDAAVFLAEEGIDPAKRAEELAVAEFIQLADRLDRADKAAKANPELRQSNPTRTSPRS